MPKGNSFNWHTESLKQDLLKIVLSMHTGDCFTSKTLAILLHKTENTHSRKSGTKRLNAKRRKDIGVYIQARSYFSRLMNSLAKHNDNVNLLKRYMRKGCVTKKDILGNEIFETQYYEVQ